MTWGRSYSEPPVYTPAFVYRDGKPICGVPGCGRGVGRLGASFCMVLVGEPRDGRLEGRCKRHWNEELATRMRLHNLEDMSE